jgi:hypothetical protein
MSGGVRDERPERAQILEVEEQETPVVGELEGDLEDALLRVVQLEDPGEQRGPDLAHRPPDGMSRLAVEVPEDDGARLLLVTLDADLRDALRDPVARGARHCDPRDVALHVGDEGGDPHPREALRHDEERDGLARARRPRDVAVAVAVLREQGDGLLALADEDLVHAPPPSARPSAHGVMLRQRGATVERNTTVLRDRSDSGR